MMEETRKQKNNVTAYQEKQKGMDEKCHKAREMTGIYKKGSIGNFSIRTEQLSTQSVERRKSSRIERDTESVC